MLTFALMSTWTHALSPDFFKNTHTQTHITRHIGEKTRALKHKKQSLTLRK